jgi:L,D-transpeptidase YcbB
MKKLCYLLAAVMLFAACADGSGPDAEGDNSPSGEGKSKNVSKRDYSITKENSYSDLFFDSTAMEAYIAQHQVPDSIGNRMRSFYNARNYQFAWFNSTGFTEDAFAFWNVFDHYTTYSKDTTLTDKTLEKTMNRLLTSDDGFKVSGGDKSYQQTELRLTYSFIQYILKNYEKGYVKRKEMERFVPFKKSDPIALADSLLNKKHKDNKYFGDVNKNYKALQDQLQRYLDIHKKGGWPQIPEPKKPLKVGVSGPEVQALKQYLVTTGDLQGGDTTLVFDEALADGVKRLQQRFGFEQTGVVGKDLVKEMNVPARTRIEQLLINMNRMRWMPSQPNGTLIVVNIPEFKLHVSDNGSKVFDMDVVVGKEGHNTVQFTGTMNQVVFAPYWNVPPSIVTKEILPSIEKNGNYLADNNMENQGDKDGDGVPEIRQLPGEKNSLGKAKFLFPNSYDIYLHDTPAKSLFDKAKRAYSHGCIRLADAEKMATYLLRNDPDWDEAKIQAAMSGNEQKAVKLKEPAEVFITYYTAWVDEGGQLNFRGDVYGHDKKITKELF